MTKQQLHSALRAVSESAKAIEEAEMEKTLADITSQTLEYYNNESKGDEERREKVRQDLLKLIEDETSRVKQHNLERLQMEKEKAITDAVTVAVFDPADE